MYISSFNDIILDVLFAVLLMFICLKVNFTFEPRVIILGRWGRREKSSFVYLIVRNKFHQTIC